MEKKVPEVKHTFEYPPPEQPQSVLAVQNGGADFTVVDRKQMIQGTEERHESKQQALRGTGVKTFIVDGLNRASLSFGSYFQSNVLQWPP